ncbi:MAG TPA: HepT-like ribonuclease domain-containing protein [Allosphingosinicella sp.]|jgi:uncharacterized protein with HEPN domain
MAPGPEADGLYLERILELIESIENSLAEVDQASFLASRDKVDVTAFRLFQIGELTNKLSEGPKQRHPEIAWPSIYGLRNLIAHHYDKTNPTALWTIAANSLSTLRTVCQHELDHLDG